VAPAAARVELPDEVEQVGSGRVEVHDQLGDLVAQPVHLGSRCRDRGNVGVHRCRPLGGEPTLHPGFGPTCEPQGPAITERLMISRHERSHTGLGGRVRLAGTGFCRGRDGTASRAP
jgi:hypothetical protein